MSRVEKRTIDLPPEDAAFVDGLVESGTYASASDVVSEGLLALREREAALERWLREEVAPTYDAMLADPSRALTSKEVLAAIDAHHRKRLAEKP